VLILINKVQTKNTYSMLSYL